MKKSEMIDQLVKHIEEIHQNMGNLLSPRMAVLTILNKAEELGMSPPNSSGIVFGWNEGFIEAPEWDTEDEIK